MAIDFASAPYIDRVHAALSDNLDGFNKPIGEFKQAMSDPYYAANVHAALTDNLPGFNKTLEEFHDNVADPRNPVTNVPAKQFFADYMSSPIYKQRLTNFGITQKPDVNNLLNTTISSVVGPGSIAYNQQRSALTDTKHAGFPITKGKSNINLDPSQLAYVDKQYGVDQKGDNTAAHELSHVSRELSPKEQELIASLNKKPDEAAVYNEWKKTPVVDSDLKPLSFSDYLNTAYKGTHDARPGEIKADLDALRFQMAKKGIYDTSKRDMTIDDYNKAIKDKEIQKSLEFKRLMQRFSPNDIIKLNNTIASNNNPNQQQNIS